MKKILFVSLLGSLFTVAMCDLAAAEDAGMGRRDGMRGSHVNWENMGARRLRVFEKRDLNSDGYLSKDEFDFKDTRKKVKDLDEIEQREVEMEFGKKKYWERNKQMREDRKDRKFKEMDRDNDGMISKDEFMNRSYYKRNCLNMDNKY